MNNRNLENIAYHEAGHVVVSYLFGIPTKFASIEPAYAGPLAPVKIELKKRISQIFNTHGHFFEDREFFKDYLVIYMSGPVAEAKYKGESVLSEIPSSDLLEMSDFVLTSFLGNKKVSDAYISYIIEEAWSEVEKAETWKFIGEVATGLLKHNTLNSKQLSILNPLKNVNLESTGKKFLVDSRGFE